MPSCWWPCKLVFPQSCKRLGFRVQGLGLISPKLASPTGCRKAELGHTYESKAKCLKPLFTTEELGRLRDSENMGFTHVVPDGCVILAEVPFSMQPGVTFQCTCREIYDACMHTHTYYIYMYVYVYIYYIICIYMCICIITYSLSLYIYIFLFVYLLIVSDRIPR